MTAAVRVLPGRYVDSVVLMRLAQSLAHQDGVADAAAMMATAANKELLAAGGFLPEPPAAGANDLLVSVKADSGAAATAALARVEELLAAPSAGGGARVVSAATLDDALARQPETNIALISLPGEYAAAEARRALEHGLHVFLFSSNVAVEDEIALKRLAAERGLLCMGPDCGTAIVAGVGLGFANAVRRGPVGVVGASGTGIQAVTSLLDRFEVGVSHAIGCGSRDLSDAVGAATALAGLDALLADGETKAIVLLSKPPSPAVAARLRERAAAAPKPVLVCFLGDPETPWTLDEIAVRAAESVGQRPAPLPPALDDDEIERLRAGLASSRRYVRGLYAGGTLAYEAQLVLRGEGLELASNAPLRGSRLLPDANRSEGHTIVDLGSEEFVVGRPHPMIDARTRRLRLLQEAADPEVAVVLLDVVLGFGAAADPAGDLAPAISESVGRADAPVVLAHVCGTDRDPQGRPAQEDTLRATGAIVLPTNAAMARTAARLVAR